MLTRREALLGTAAGTAGAVLMAAMAATPALAQVPAADIKSLPRQKVNLVAPPFVHEHEQVATGGPKVVEFQLTVKEQPVVIDREGTTMRAMTYNGSIPAPMMIVHEGDYVELTLVNPGEQVVLRFKATRTGTFVYHCAPDGMIPWHVVSGMSGTIMVLPRDGLKDGNGKQLTYDKLFYIGENDFYVPRDENGKYKSYETL
ncbi:MAG: multicopper oxidase domain-containing protein, partial [Mesorhizobium sp.]|nr:multicopper oxidase domain-containing protein [Mesorhizobium sp.]